jgi:cysteine-S-conjugate beta-lyase
MGKYNFDEIVNRRGTGCVKWDAASPAGPIDEDVIPMWVADMDFKAAPEIMEAIQKRLDQGVFGYTSVPDSYYRSAIDWWQRRRGWHTEKDWYLPIAGLVPAMSVIIKALTQYEVVDGKVVERADRGRGPKGELPKVIIQNPAYNCFFSTVKDNLCELSENRLIYDTEGDQATWYLNFEDLEKRASDPMAKILLFCNPHNPCGRVWHREELQKVDEICRRHGVIVISDEIHCELEMPGSHFIPMASLSQEAQANTITLNSPSKSFNIAGLGISNIVTNNPEWKALIDRAMHIGQLCELNPFGVVALEAAYDHGEAWLKELNEYLWGNYRHLCNRFEEEIPEIPVTRLEGTYLAWIDVRSLGISADTIAKNLIENEKVWINSGVMYGREGFMRINLACPRARLEEGVERMIKGFKRLKFQGLATVATMNLSI